MFSRNPLVIVSTTITLAPKEPSYYHLHRPTAASGEDNWTDLNPGSSPTRPKVLVRGKKGNWRQIK